MYIIIYRNVVMMKKSNLYKNKNYKYQPRLSLKDNKQNYNDVILDMKIVFDYSILFITFFCGVK